MRSRSIRTVLAIALACLLVAGVAVVTVRSVAGMAQTHIVAYFDNSNGLFVGDEVRILGVAVGEIDKIEAQPGGVKITFWVASKYKVPADANAVILSPQLITSRAIQLTPAYTGGPVLTDRAVIPRNRTAVPVEWDDLRAQLEKLTDSLQPTQPGGVSTLGAFINTAAANLKGQGASIHDSIIKLSQAISILGDHSDDIFGTIKNLSVLVSALHDSADLLSQLNLNLSSVSALVSDDPNKIGQAVSDLSAVVGDATSFIADNRETLGTTTDKLSSISKAVYDSLGDIKQTLHVAPNAFQNFTNIYSPSQAAVTGELVVNNFANPITFLCGAIQAASRLGAEQSAKLCAQYLAPIVKNRQYNFPPIGLSPIVGESARPNEITYTEDWMRPDYVPAPPISPADAPLPAEAVPASNPPPTILPPDSKPSTATNPSAGLPGIMVPEGGGS
jgi:phospholipid/cholesterol/gamma-HCH transport system substrate-binding protein